MTETNKCPKCAYSSDTCFSECPACGIIISKFVAIENEQKQDERDTAVGTKAALQTFQDSHALKIQQCKEWGEILTGFETRNRYRIMDSWGNQLFDAEEVSGSIFTLLSRLMLNWLRPFTITIYSENGEELFSLKRPFRFYFHQVMICKPNGAILGKVTRRFTLLRRNYSVTDKADRDVFSLIGPIFRPWTFLIHHNHNEAGKIVKKWSGLAKEAFTDADDFGIHFPKEISTEQKALLLGAVFLIDFVHFEMKSNHGYN